MSRHEGRNLVSRPGGEPSPRAKNLGCLFISFHGDTLLDMSVNIVQTQRVSVSFQCSGRRDGDRTGNDGQTLQDRKSLVAMQHVDARADPY